MGSIWAQSPGPELDRAHRAGPAGLAPIGPFYEYVTTIFVRRRRIKGRDKAAAAAIGTEMRR